MADITNGIKLSLVLDVVANPIKTIRVKQFNQNTYILTVTFTNNGTVFPVNSSTEIVSLKIVTPGGHNHYLFDGTINSDGTATFVLPQQLSWTAGLDGLGNVDIIDASTGTKRVPTLTFNVIVDASAYNDGVIVDSDDFALFTHWIAQGNTLLSQCRTYANNAAASATAAANSLATLQNTCVKKSGDTMSGNLVINAGLTVSNAIVSTGNFTRKHADYTRGTAPSAASYASYVFTDVDGKNVSYLGSVVGTNGNHMLRLCVATPSVDGGNTDALMVTKTPSGVITCSIVGDTTVDGIIVASKNIKVVANSAATYAVTVKNSVGEVQLRITDAGIKGVYDATQSSWLIRTKSSSAGETGDVVVPGAFQASSLITNGSATIGSTLAVTGNTTIQGSLSVTGIVTAAHSIKVIATDSSGYALEVQNSLGDVQLQVNNIGSRGIFDKTGNMWMIRTKVSGETGDIVVPTKLQVSSLYTRGAIEYQNTAQTTTGLMSIETANGKVQMCVGSSGTTGIYDVNSTQWIICCEHADVGSLHVSSIKVPSELTTYGLVSTRNISIDTESDAGFAISITNAVGGIEMRVGNTNAPRAGIWDLSTDNWVMYYDINDASHIQPTGDTSNFNIYMPQVYKNTTTSTGNMYVDSSGKLYKGTSSSRRYKHNITDLTDYRDILNIPVVSFVYNENYLSANDRRANTSVPGFIAEDVDEAYPIAAEYVDDQVEDWNVRYIVPPMLALEQEHDTQIKALQDQIAELTNLVKQLTKKK